MRLFNPRFHHFPFFFVVLFLVACAAPQTKPDSQENLSKGLLWKVEKEGVSSPSYIFGTIHSEDERVLMLPSAVSVAFNGSQTFALEMLLNSEASKTVLNGMYFNNGRDLKSVISADLYQKSVSSMKEKGLDESLVNMMKPWAVFTILNMPDQKTGLFLDAKLYRDALNLKKQIVGLESAKEQLAVFDEMELALQISLLESTLANNDDMSNIMEETLKIYLSKDLNEILKLNDKYLKLIEKDVAEVFTKRLITDRNQRMVERMAALLDSGNVFIAVGALHLPGKEGILKLIQNRGYSISSVY